MTRRLSRIAVAALAAFGLTAAVPTAHALTNQTKVCVKEARTRLKLNTKAAQAAARAAYSTEFTSCFGPGAKCASDCLTAQAACQKPFQDSANLVRENTCKVNFNKALDICRDDTVTPEPQQCASAARLEQFACVQAAAADIAPDLDACNSEFSACTAACASAR